MMGTMLGVDLGSRRIGLAVSEPAGLGPRPLYALARGSNAADMAKIAEIAAAYAADTIVVGLPVRMGGEEGPEAERARQFARGLAKRTQARVVTWDERLTTAEAEEALLAADVGRRKRRELVDALAAAAILRSYLAARGKGGEG